MNLWQNGELILVLAPLCSLSLNVIVQFGLYRYARFRLMGSILGGLLAGIAPLFGLMFWSFTFASPLPTLDILALSVTMIAIYLGGCAVIFAVINLGETSLRIRMLQMLNKSPNGMKRSEVVEIYDDTALFEIRVNRLIEQRQVIRTGDVVIIRRSAFFYIAALIRAFKWLLYGSPPRQFNV
jgi:hypothetical protein